MHCPSVIGGIAAAALPRGSGSRSLSTLFLAAALLAAPLAMASTELRMLTLQQELLRAEMAQLDNRLAELQQLDRPEDHRPSREERKLSAEREELTQQLAELAEREAALLGDEEDDSTEVAATYSSPTGAPVTMETKPLRSSAPTSSEEHDASQVAHLMRLLDQAENVEQTETTTSSTQQPPLESMHEDAQRLARIPFSVDKVRLNGAEGSTALLQISARLADPNLAHSRRETAPICSVKTRVNGKLVDSEQRSLRPVGKHHYVARLQLQAGDTSIAIQGDRWDIHLPADISARDYLVTLYRPPGASPEFHLVAVDDLLAEEQAHIPAWLPAELKLTRGEG